MQIQTRARRKRNRPMSEMNLVPYIDVMLVLVVILMITAPLLTQGVHVQLPSASAKALPQKTAPIIVSVDTQGNLYLNTSATPSQVITPQDLMSQVSTQLQASQAQHQERDVYVKGDRNANYGEIMNAMVLLQKAGASDVGLITKSPPKAPAAAT
ncbi:MAG: protein TolR [Gammaproteobacteria bacterium]|nr:protein TolR [Gammaproteobacteria bacterium]